MSLLRQVDESRFLSILVRGKHISRRANCWTSSRAHVVTYTRGIYPPETVAVTSFPWELFGNRWGKVPRTGCPPPVLVPGRPASALHGNAISFSPAIFLLSDAEYVGVERICDSREKCAGVGKSMMARETMPASIRRAIRNRMTRASE